MYRLEEILLASVRCVPPSFTLVPPMSESYETYLFPDKKKLCILIFLPAYVGGLDGLSGRNENIGV